MRQARAAVLTDTGDLYAWQFNHGISGETFITPFAHVMPGSRSVGSTLYWEDSAVGGVLVLQPDGTVAVLMDADTNDLRSGSLKPQLFKVLDAAPAAVRLNDDGSVDYGFDQGFIVGSTYWVRR